MREGWAVICYDQHSPALEKHTGHLGQVTTSLYWEPLSTTVEQIPTMHCGYFLVILAISVFFCIVCQYRTCDSYRPYAVFIGTQCDIEKRMYGTLIPN